MSIIRRTIFWLITVGLVWVARGVWDYTPDIRERLTRSPLQSVIFVALLLVAIALFAWLFNEDATRPKMLWALLLGGAVALWGKDLLSGIAWGQIGALIGILVAMGALWYISTWDYIIEPGTGQRMVQGLKSRLAPRTPAPQATPATVAPTTTASQPAVVPHAGSSSVFQTAPPPPPPPPPARPATQAP